MNSFQAYQAIHKAISIIESGEIDNLSIGRHELTEGIYVSVLEYDTKEKGLFESHHKYIDIHYPLNGSEIIEIADEELLDITEQYNEKDDYVLGNAEGLRYLIKAKHPFVVMPGEAHLPGLMVDRSIRIKKAIIKVPL
jgi:biofilm protein TabA